MITLNDKPAVKTLENGSKFWEKDFAKFSLSVYVPANNLNGHINNYSFRAPLLVVFEETKLSEEEIVNFATTSGLDKIAAADDASILFVYPTCEGGWDNADESLYIDLISEVKISHVFEDGIASDVNPFTFENQGYYIRGSKFRTDIYSFGKSADYAARCLIKTIDGEYLWGPGQITPAMVSMERLSVIPDIKRKDIPVLSVNNSDEINSVIKESTYHLIKDEADYVADFKSFVRKYKMWCDQVEFEPDFDELNMTFEAHSLMVKTSNKNWALRDKVAEHEVGYFTLHNNDIFENGPAPLVIGLHGAGDSALLLTHVSGWYKVAHDHGFLFAPIDNHYDIPAEEIMSIIEDIKKHYNVDPKRIYAIGFSMGCAKTWDLFEQFPETFAGIAPASALMPVYSNPFGLPILRDRLNDDCMLPVFYSGGMKSFVTELPVHSADGLERLTYASKVNKLKKKFDITFEDKSNWTDPALGIKGDRCERIHDDERDDYINVHYYDSEDGVCRTAFAYVENQVHEYRHHTAELAWNFISKFTR